MSLSDPKDYILKSSYVLQPEKAVKTLETEAHGCLIIFLFLVSKMPPGQSVIAWQMHLASREAGGMGTEHFRSRCWIGLEARNGTMEDVRSLTFLSYVGKPPSYRSAQAPASLSANWMRTTSLCSVCLTSNCSFFLTPSYGLSHIGFGSTTSIACSQLFKDGERWGPSRKLCWPSDKWVHWHSVHSGTNTVIGETRVWGSRKGGSVWLGLALTG